MKYAILLFGVLSLLLTGSFAVARNVDKGYLTVDADPAAVSLYVDGEYLGPAVQGKRIKKYELTAGAHSVRLAFDGYEESVQHIYVTPGHVTGLAIALSPKR